MTKQQINEASKSLEKIIIDTELRKKEIADKIGMKRMTFYRRVKKPNNITVEELQSLYQLLGNEIEVWAKIYIFTKYDTLNTRN